MFKLCLTIIVITGGAHVQYIFIYVWLPPLIYDQSGVNPNLVKYTANDKFYDIWCFMIYVWCLIFLNNWIIFIPLNHYENNISDDDNDDEHLELGCLVDVGTTSYTRSESTKQQYVHVKCVNML